MYTSIEKWRGVGGRLGLQKYVHNVLLKYLLWKNPVNTTLKKHLNYSYARLNLIYDIYALYQVKFPYTVCHLHGDIILYEHVKL